ARCNPSADCRILDTTHPYAFDRKRRCGEARTCAPVGPCTPRNQFRTAMCHGRLPGEQAIAMVAAHEARRAPCTGRTDGQVPDGVLEALPDRCHRSRRPGAPG